MVAAELWGVPVGAILEKARSGAIPTKNENGFLFIDVAPESPTCEPPKHLRPPHPPTYVVVTADAVLPHATMAAAVASTSSEGVTMMLDENQMPPIPRDDWRVGRQHVSRARRRPSMN
jgi:hypothetical protein